MWTGLDIPAPPGEGMTENSSLLRVCLLFRFAESFAYFTVNNIFALHLTESLGIGDARAGALFGLRGAVSHVYGTLLGPVVDVLGPRRCLLAGCVVSAVGRGWFGVANTAATAAAAVYLPMAGGHALVGMSLSISVKRATSGSDLSTGGSTAWGFGLAYCATVLGIALCGPVIDAATALLHPLPPYRHLALLSAGVSVVSALAGGLYFYAVPSVGAIAPMVFQPSPRQSPSPMRP